jgi:hypothetical protein
MPDFGGYGSDTEYEVGAGIIAESAHCILGSLGRAYRRLEGEWNPDLEWGHIREEISLIKGAMSEYPRPVYLDQINDPERRKQSAYIKSSIKSINDVSPGLQGQAEAMRVALRSQSDVPAWAMEIGTHSYDVIIALARAMKASVAGWPGEIPQAMSAFRNPGLSTAVANLGTAINNWEGVMGREVEGGAGLAGKAGAIRLLLRGGGLIRKKVKKNDLPTLYRPFVDVFYQFKGAEDDPGSELREELADLAHEQWSGWMRYLFENWNDDSVARWKRQMETPYTELSEEEQDSDRKEADRVLAVLKKHGVEASRRQEVVELPREVTEALALLPETGMGYQMILNGKWLVVR